MSELREAAQEALFWMQHARLHLTIKERLHPDGLIQYDNAARNLRAALAQPKTELRDQHKAFAEWFLQQNPIAPNVEDMAWAAWKAALEHGRKDGTTALTGEARMRAMSPTGATRTRRAIVRAAAEIGKQMEKAK